MNTKLVSIILPTYNGQDLIKNSIDSVINQTYKNWELIIVNDCSNDQTPQIINEYAKKDSRIKIINNEKNQKLPASLNIGFKEAKGDYHTWTSDDNEYLPNAIETMVNYLENHQNVSFVYAGCKIIKFQNGKDVKQNGISGNLPATIENMLTKCICGACFLYKKEVWLQVGEYDTNKFLAEDYDYWLRVRLEYEMANINEILYIYRLQPKSLTSSHNKKSMEMAVNLSLYYCPLFEQKYGKIKNNILEIRKSWKDNNLKDIKLLKNKIPKKEIYQELKSIYKFSRDFNIIRAIGNLGFRYIPKAIRVFIQYGVLK